MDCCNNPVGSIDAIRQAHPEVKGRVRFVLAGRSEPSDQAWARKHGLLALSNLGDDELLAAPLATFFKRF